MVTQRWTAISGWDEMKVEAELPGLLVGLLNFVRQDESSLFIQGHFFSCCVTYHHSGNLQDLLFWLVEAWANPSSVYIFGFIHLVSLRWFFSPGNSLTYLYYANHYSAKCVWNPMQIYIELCLSLCISLLSASMPYEFLPPWPPWSPSSLSSIQSDHQTPCGSPYLWCILNSFQEIN